MKLLAEFMDHTHHITSHHSEKTDADLTGLYIQDITVLYYK